MEQYLLIARQIAPNKFDNYRIIKFDPARSVTDNLPVDFVRVSGPADLEDCSTRLADIGDNNSKWFGLTKWQYILIAFVTIVFVAIVVFGAYKLPSFGAEKDETGKLLYGQDDSARILITFLVAVGTIAIAFLATLTAMIIREYKERFALAKEVLTILVGILGTIVGFYFGTANNPLSKGNLPAIPTATATPVQSNASGAKPSPPAA